MNAAFVSLLASAQMHGIEPWSYLRHLFVLLPRWPKRHALELAPHAWRDTLQRDDVQPYRPQNLAVPSTALAGRVVTSAISRQGPT